MTDCTSVALEMSPFPFMVCLFFPYHLVLVSSEPAYAKLPERITALSGSCVQIPCTFDVPETVLKDAQTIFSFWIKTGHNFNDQNNLVVFNGRAEIVRGFSHIEIIGNLSRRECTTAFYDVMKNHSDIYYFRVEMYPASWNYTYSVNPINISVSDVPQPLILQPNDLKEVMENTTVNLSCSAEAPCPKQPPAISWTNIPESAHITTQLQGKLNSTQSMFSHMTFKASYMDHRKNISCTATYPRKTSNDSTVETSVMLRVLFPPKETRITIDPSASVSVGTNVTLTCKSKASPSHDMIFYWHKRGEDNQLDVGETLTFTVNSRSRGWYFCIAKNEHGFQNSNEIQLIVEELLSLIIGCIVGVSAFLLIFLLITLFLRAQRVKASTIRETDISDQCQEKQVHISSIYANGAFVSGEELEMPKDPNDTMHYGQIDFSTPQTKSTTVKSSGQETIYAEVRGPEKEMNQD